MKVETIFILSLSEQYTDPDEWSQEIGLMPLRICKKGERVSPNPRALISPNSYWVFGIKCYPENTVEDQLSRVLDQVYDKKNKILNLTKRLKLDVKINTYVWIDDLSDLSVIFSNDVLKKMAELGILFTFTRY